MMYVKSISPSLAIERRRIEYNGCEKQQQRAGVTKSVKETHTIRGIKSKQFILRAVKRGYIPKFVIFQGSIYQIRTVLHVQIRTFQCSSASYFQSRDETLTIAEYHICKHFQASQKIGAIFTLRPSRTINSHRMYPNLYTRSKGS